MLLGLIFMFSVASLERTCMFVGFMPYDARPVLFRGAALTHLCLAQLPAMPFCLFGFDYISHVTKEIVYISYFRLASRVATHICTLSRRHLIVWMVSVCLMKTSDHVDGVCSRGDLP